MKKLNPFFLSTLVVAMFFVFSIGVVQAGKCILPEFVNDDFSSSYDNPYLPLSVIGKKYVYEAEDEDGLIRNYIYYSYDTKTIEGVTCVVVYDVEFIWVEEIGEWRKLEETEDWHAWDYLGNFWYLGEWTTEFEYDDDWNQTGSNNDGSWEADISEGIYPGIILPYDPAPGDCNQQEYYEDEAEDVGKVLKVKATCEDLDGIESEECMVMKEWTALQPGNVEHKTYYPDIGLVHIKELKEKTVEVELVDIDTGPIPDPPPDLLP